MLRNIIRIPVLFLFPIARVRSDFFNSNLNPAASFSVQRIKADILPHLRDRMSQTECESTGRNNKPFVTVTWAQCLDGSISNADKTPHQISNEMSTALTHAMRSIHDGILIGGNTARIDNPRLNVRHWPVSGNSGPTVDANPRPIILSSLDSLPVVLRADGALILTDLSTSESQDLLSKRNEYRSDMKKHSPLNSELILHCPSSKSGSIDVVSCLETLQSIGIRSVMVEGGGKVIRSFFEAEVVDMVVITIAPKMIGGYVIPEKVAGDNDLVTLEKLQYYNLNEDIIVIGKPSQSKEGKNLADKRTGIDGIL